MAQISTHLNVKPYQVAISTDKSLPHRKWDHQKGFQWSVSNLSAAYDFRASKGLKGDEVAGWSCAEGVIYQFPDGQFVKVGFGS
jgi:hypothetical protein